MKQQTPIEWLIEKLDSNLDINHSWRTRQYIEQSKKIEAEQQKKMVDDAITNYELGWADKNINKSYPSEQTEISDEEIRKWAKEYTCKEYEKLIFDYENYDTYNDFVNGAKKYREQLKLK